MRYQCQCFVVFLRGLGFGGGVRGKVGGGDGYRILQENEIIKKSTFYTNHANRVTSDQAVFLVSVCTIACCRLLGIHMKRNVHQVSSG